MNFIKDWKFTFNKYVKVMCPLIIIINLLEKNTMIIQDLIKKGYLLNESKSIEKEKACTLERKMDRHS